MSARAVFFGLVVSLVLAFFVSPYASKWPDGLERVAEDKGFIEKGEGPAALTSPVPDYAWPGVRSEYLATGLAGLIGTLAVFACAYGAASLMKRRVR